VEGIHVSLKSDENNRNFSCSPMYIYDNFPLNSSQNEKCLILSLRENRNTHKVYTKCLQKWC